MSDTHDNQPLTIEDKASVYGVKPEILKELKEGGEIAFASGMEPHAIIALRKEWEELHKGKMAGDTGVIPILN